MSKIRFAVCVVVLLAIISGSDLWAQGLNEEPMTPEEIAGFFEDAAHQRLSVEGFAREVEKRALLTAARTVREGKIKEKTIEVDLKLKVTLIPGPFPSYPPEFPGVPGPHEIDMCWEICPSLDCYINCTAPGIEIIHRPIRTCDDNRENLRAATAVAHKIMYLRELLRMGCLDRQEVIIGFRPIERPPQ